MPGAPRERSSRGADPSPRRATTAFFDGCIAIARARPVTLRERDARASASRGRELDAADLARREQAHALAGEAKTVADDERRIAVAENAAVVAGDELGEVADAAAEKRRQRELAAVRVAGEDEARAELGRVTEAIRPMREDDERHARGDPARERRQRRMLEHAARPVAAEVVDADDGESRPIDGDLDDRVPEDREGRVPQQRRRHRLGAGID